MEIVKKRPKKTASARPSVKKEPPVPAKKATGGIGKHYVFICSILTGKGFLSQVCTNRGNAKGATGFSPEHASVEMTEDEFVLISHLFDKSTGSRNGCVKKDRKGNFTCNIPPSEWSIASYQGEEVYAYLLKTGKLQK